VFRMSRASLLARLPLYCSSECATPTKTSLFVNFPRNLAQKPRAARLHVVVCIFKGGGGAFLFTATPRTRKEFLSRQSLLWLKGRTIGALRAERHTVAFAEWTSCSACHELLCSRAFFFIVLRSAQHPQKPRFL